MCCLVGATHTSWGGDRWIWSNGGMILAQKNLRTWRKTCPSATLSTTNPTWINPSANLGLHGDRPANNLPYTHDNRHIPWCPVKISHTDGQWTWPPMYTWKQEHTLVSSQGPSSPCVPFVHLSAFLPDEFSLQQLHLCHPLPAFEYLDEVCHNNIRI
jgi:hypothetical protein